MRFLSFALGGFLLSVALPALAQTTPAETPATPRFFVGLGAYSSRYQQLGGQYNSSPRLPLQLTVGYQVRPRLAVQMGVAYSGATASYAESTQYASNAASPTPTYYAVDAHNTLRQTSASALARYTLTANQAHRMQFDALGGFALEHRNSYSRGTQTDNFSGTLTTFDYAFHSTQNNLLLTAGLGARYRLGRCVELTYDFTVNKALSGYDRGLTGSQALGVRYRFGR